MATDKIQEAAKEYADRLARPKYAYWITASEEKIFMSSAFEAGAIWQEQQGWVRVEDGLPEKMASCFVWYTANLCQPHIRTATYLGDGYFSTSGIGHRTFKVTHWRHQFTPPGSTPVESKEGVYRKALVDIRSILNEKEFTDVDTAYKIATEALKP